MKKIGIIIGAIIILALAGFWWWYVLKGSVVSAPTTSEIDKILNESPMPFPPQAASLPVTIPTRDGTTAGFDIPATFTVATHDFGVNQESTVVEVTLMPQDLRGEIVEGLGFAFSAQPPFPRPWSAYLQGSLKDSNWICNVNIEETDYTCEGTTPMPLNQGAVLQLLFRSQEFAPSAVPTTLTLRLLQYGETIATVVAIKK